MRRAIVLLFVAACSTSPTKSPNVDPPPSVAASTASARSPSPSPSPAVMVSVAARAIDAEAFAVTLTPPGPLAQLSVGMPITEALTLVPAFASVPAGTPAERALSFEAPVPGYAEAWYRIAVHEGTRRIRAIEIRTIASPRAALVARWGQPVVNSGRDFWRGPSGEHVVVNRDYVVQRDPVASWFVHFSRFEPVADRVTALEAMVGVTRAELASRGRFGLESERRSTDHGDVTLSWIDLPPTEWTWTGDERVFVGFGPGGRVTRVSTTLALSADSSGPSSRGAVEALIARRFGPAREVQVYGSARKQHRKGGKTVTCHVHGETSFDLEMTSP